MIFLASQSVNDLRFLLASGAALLTYGPGTTVASLTNTPEAVVWS